MRNDNFKWRQKTTPVTLAQINAKVAARLQFFEDELRARGMYVVCGAEQKLYALDSAGQGWKGDADLKKIKSHLTDISLLEKASAGGGLPGKHEFVLGTVGQDFYSFYPSITLARQLLKLRKVLPAIMRKHGNVPMISFDPSHRCHHTATAGLHINASLFGTELNNLFYDSKETFSPVATGCVRVDCPAEGGIAVICASAKIL